MSELKIGDKVATELGDGEILTISGTIYPYYVSGDDFADWFFASELTLLTENGGEDEKI